MFITKKKKEAYDNEIDRLRHQIEELTQIVKTQELLRLRAENERLKEKERLISKIKFNLRDVSYLEEEDIILVKYNLPFLRVVVGSDGKVQKNEMFYAINKLQLLPLDDLKRISKVIDNVKQMKQNEK